MKVFVKNKLTSLRGSSQVLDENKNPVFKVVGKFFSITHKKRVMDMDNNLLYIVRNKFWKFLMPSSYVMTSDGEKVCKVKKKFNLQNNFVVTGYKDEITIDGSFWGLEMKIMRNGQQIGTLRRNLTIIADSFELEGDEKDIPFLVALVIAIDNIFDRMKR
jgi:uncharacterized protein YxjI